MPPLKASPGAVAFGEVYLTWSKQGLAVATIGQDYDDLGLLDYGARYPLSEAYRVEIDIDAGAGPKRFTLYFIPPQRLDHGLSADGAEALRRHGRRVARQ